MPQSADILRQRGMELLHKPRAFGYFTGMEAADKLLNDIEGMPHIFVLGCLMDLGIKAERAWQIPYQVGLTVHDFHFSALLETGLDKLTAIFEEQNLHRYKRKMANVFYLGLERIQEPYDGNAANIWRDRPSSAIVVRRFREFHGAGIKISTMAANILARKFKIPMSDYSSIDISPDVHIKRVFERLGYIHVNADNSEIVYKARELNPTYPGVFDSSVWEIGQKWCRPSNPACGECYLKPYCPKVGVNEGNH